MSMMRLRGADMVFPAGTEFYTKEGDVPLALLSGGLVLNAFGGSINRYSSCIDPTSSYWIDRQEFNRIVDENFGAGCIRDDAVTALYAGAPAEPEEPATALSRAYSVDTVIEWLATAKDQRSLLILSNEECLAYALAALEGLPWRSAQRRDESTPPRCPGPSFYVDMASERWPSLTVTQKRNLGARITPDYPEDGLAILQALFDNPCALTGREGDR